MPRFRIKDFIKCVIFKFDLNYCTPLISSDYNYDNKTFYNEYTKNKDLLDDEDDTIGYKSTTNNVYIEEDISNDLIEYKEECSFESINLFPIHSSL